MDESSPNYAKIMGYIDRNPAAVLSTIGDDGAPHGAVVYICTASHRTVCFVTKDKTRKYTDIIKHPQVSLTVFDEKESSTLQAEGQAYISDDRQMIDYVLQKTAKIHAMQADWLPPASKISDGEYVVVSIELSSARLAEYRGIGMGGATFTELG